MSEEILVEEVVKLGRTLFGVVEPSPEEYAWIFMELERNTPTERIARIVFNNEDPEYVE